MNSAAAITPVTLYRIPTAALEARLRRNPGLDYQIICNLCHELRKAQQHAFLLNEHRAVAKLGLFLQMLETQQNSQNLQFDEVSVPMSRADIGAFINISPEAVSRAVQELLRRGVISVRNRRYFKIVDRAGLEDIVTERGGASQVGALLGFHAMPPRSP